MVHRFAPGQKLNVGVVGATDPTTCYFTYTQPNVANTAATISGLTISGC